MKTVEEGCIGAHVILVSGQHVPAADVRTDGCGVPYITGPSQFINGRPSTKLTTERPRAICRRGDILVTVKGSGTGTLAVADRAYAISRQLMAVQPQELDASFAFEVLSRQVEFLRRSAVGLIPGISRRDVLNIPVPSYPVRAQRQIGQLLANTRRCEAVLGELIVAKRRFNRGLAQQLLTGRRRFKEFESEAWSERSVGDCFAEVQRPVEWDDSATYNLLSVRRRSGGVFLRSHTQGAKIKTKRMFQVRAGDFLISKMQVAHGALGIVNSGFDHMHVSGSYIVLQNKRPDQLRTKYFDYFTRLPRMYRQALLSSYGVHIEKMTFNLPWYLRSRIRVPKSVPEQERIIDLLDGLERETAILERLRDALDRQRRGVAELLLSGKVRIRA